MRATHRPPRDDLLAIDQFIIDRDLQVGKRHARLSEPPLVVVAVAPLWCRRIMVDEVVRQSLIHDLDLALVPRLFDQPPTECLVHFARHGHTSLRFDKRSIIDTGSWWCGT